MHALKVELSILQDILKLHKLAYISMYPKYLAKCVYYSSQNCVYVIKEIGLQIY